MDADSYWSIKLLSNC